MARIVTTGSVRIVYTNERLKSVTDDAGNAYNECGPMTWLGIEYIRPTRITCEYHDGTFEVRDAEFCTLVRATG